MKIIITGATGMVGQIVLDNCLKSGKISEITSLVRKPTGNTHAKLTEIVVQDFENYSQHEHLFQNINVAFFCLGVYTGEVPDDLFKKITVDYAVEFARMVAKNSPQATMCLLSGMGADRTEKSKTSFARYKGMAENGVINLGIDFYSFRPGYIYPVEVRKEPNFSYKMMRMFYPLIKVLGKKYSVTSVELANAMFNVGLNGASKRILENQDILDYKTIEFILFRIQ